MKRLKYEIIMDYIRQEYIDNQQAGNSIPTEVELAAKFGISRFPVNQAVQKLVEEGLLVRADGIGVFVKGREPERLKARTQGRPTLLALVSQVGSVDQELLLGLQDQGLPHNLLVTNLYQEAATASYEILAQRLKHSGIAGLFLAPGLHFGAGDSPSLEFARRIGEKIPVVVIDRPLPGYAGPQAMFDNAGGSLLAAQELFRQGHRQIAYFGKDDYITGRERLLGYRLGLDYCGLTRDENLEILDRGGPAEKFLPQLEARLDEGLERLFTHQPDCRAFVTFNSAFAALLYRRLAVCGRLDERTRLAGYDAPVDHDPDFLSRFLEIRRPYRQLGQAAMELMRQRLDSKRGDETRRIAPELAIPTPQYESAILAGHF